MKRQLIVSLALTSVLLGCSKNGFGNSDSSTPSSDSSSSESPTPTPPVTPTPIPTPQQNYDSYMALPWESQDASNRSWSLYLFSVIDNQTTNLLNGTSDVTNFCPNYASLSRQHKVEFWATLFSEVSYYESGWDPLNRYTETTMGTDPITGKQVVSEGLLQLSYQDILNYPTCQFNWSADKNLSSTDPRKTILDPDINLQCGAIIMSKQVSRKNAIVISSGAYWSTLMSGSRYNKIASIQKATKAISFCSN
jgi:hypothetical protein